MKHLTSLPPKLSTKKINYAKLEVTYIRLTNTKYYIQHAETKELAF